MRILVYILMFVSVAVPGTVLADAGLSMSLQDYVREALAQSPELDAAREQWQANEYKIKPESALNDPVLSFAASNYPVDSFRSDQTPMTGNEIRLAQQLPFPGKLQAREDSARNRAEWYRYRYEDARLDLARRLMEDYYRLYYLDRALEITRRNVAQLNDLSRLTEKRYEVGKGLQADVLRVHLEVSKLQDRLLTLQKQRQTIQGRFNTLAGQPAGRELVIPASLPVSPLEYDPAELLAGLSVSRPVLSAYDSRIEQYRADQRAAKLDYRPDFALWAGYRFRDENLPDGGTDFVSAGVSINLPFNRSKRADTVSSKESSLRMAQREKQNYFNNIRFNIEDYHQQAERNFQLIDLYRNGIVPQARQTYLSVLSAYEVGELDFPALIEALLSLDRHEVAYHKAISDYLSAVAGLEAASGRLAVDEI